MGLGNPGERYKNTPHNMGFMVVEEIAKAYKTDFKKRISNSRIAEFSLHREKIILAKPLTFMNLSGEAVAGIMENKRIKKNSLLVVCDDINLPLGKIRIKRRGSDGGHLGLRSIIGNLKTSDLARLRIGVGKVGVSNITEHVLGKFPKEDLELVDRIVDVAVKTVLVFIKDGIEKAMNEFN